MINQQYTTGNFICYYYFWVDAYFITMCMQNRCCLAGGAMGMNDAGHGRNVGANGYSPLRDGGSPPSVRNRRSIRLRGYDYSRAGAYFITICTQDRRCLFGTIAEGGMVLNDAGRTAADCWRQIPDHFPNVELDEWVVMPNHVHGIIVIVDSLTNAAGGAAGGANDYSPPYRRRAPPVHRGPSGPWCAGLKLA